MGNGVPRRQHSIAECCKTGCRRQKGCIKNIRNFLSQRPKQGKDKLSPFRDFAGSCGYSLSERETLICFLLLRPEQKKEPEIAKPKQPNWRLCILTQLYTQYITMPLKSNRLMGYRNSRFCQYIPRKKRILTTNNLYSEISTKLLLVFSSSSFVAFRKNDVLCRHINH